MCIQNRIHTTGTRTFRICTGCVRRVREDEPDPGQAALGLPLPAQDTRDGQAQAH